jgi:sulfide:quinone oxidoreductase
MMNLTDGPARVLIAGAGIAGIEAALALRAFAGRAAEVRLVDPGRRFTVPATATGRAFGLARGIDLPLPDVIARAGAHLSADRLDAVDPEARRVRLAGGGSLAYDALIVAIGARSEPSVAGALPFRGHVDVAAVRAMVEELEREASWGDGPSSLAVVVPVGCAWPLAAYELALMAQDRLSTAGAAVDIAVVTAEDTPLALFGPEAGAGVARMLARRGVSVHAGAAVRAWRSGRLVLAGRAPIRADRVIALPRLLGTCPPGLPRDAKGFIRIRRDGSVPGAPGVWAIGDGAGFPVKQGWIACEQADSVASSIACRLGIDMEQIPFEPILRATLVDGVTETALSVDLRGGSAESAGLADPAPARWPVPKVTGHFLAPFLREWPGGLPRVDAPARELLPGLTAPSCTGTPHDGRFGRHAPALRAGGPS